MFAVLLEVGGKQRYIFGTNKLREVVGASELVSAATTTWVSDATASIEGRGVGVRFETVVCVSGLALLTADGADDQVVAGACRDLVWTVTRRALTDAPGLEVRGAVRAVASGVTREDADALRAEVERCRVASPVAARAPRLPVVASCATSAGPAVARFGTLDGQAQPLSAASAAKRRLNKAARDRIGAALPGFDLVRPADFEESLDAADDVGWLGVVHADGNQMGRVFERLGHGATGADYQRRYGEVSRELDACTQRALRDATEWFEAAYRGAGNTGALPLVPLIFGGDDVTVLLHGRYAIGFAVAYLRAFTARTAGSTTLATQLADTIGSGLTASAGVAVVKPHFPFATAYDLCGQACDSAKKLARRVTAAGGRPVPALDWHVQLDSTGGDLKRVRRELRRERGDHRYALLARPYVLGDDHDDLPAVAAERCWSRLEELAEQVPVRAHPVDDTALPATQLHGLRRLLVAGDIKAAEQRFAVLRARPELALLGRLGGVPGDSLFRRVSSLDDDRLPGTSTDSEDATVLLDFLDLVDFLAPTITAPAPAGRS